LGVSGNSAPRELHASVGRKDSVSGTSVVGDSVANERELTLVGELGVVNSSGGSGISVCISRARRTNRGSTVVRGVASRSRGVAASRVRSVGRNIGVRISRIGVGVWSVGRSIVCSGVWSIGRIAWSVGRIVVWSVVSRGRWGVSVIVAGIGWVGRRGGGCWRKSRNSTSVE
jgi:hypothetical protein